MGEIALSQNMSLDGVMQLDGLMQSPGPRTPRSSTRAGPWTSTAVPRVADSTTRKSSGWSRRRTPRRFCSAGSPTRPCRAYWPTAEGELADMLKELPKSPVRFRGCHCL
jgi:hypothetical protein